MNAIRCFLAVVVCAAAVRAEAPPVDAPVEAAPVTAPAAPVAAPPVVAPRAIAPESAVQALDHDLATLNGLARAERLLAFAASWPDDPRAHEAVTEARAIVADDRTRHANDPVLEAINVALQAPSAERPGRIAALEQLHDSRAVPFLGYLAVRDADEPTRVRAALALGAFGEAGAEPLAGIATNTVEREAVRVAAVTALGKTGTDRAGRLLVEIAENPDEDAAVIDGAAAALKANPALAERFPLGTVVGGSSGRALGTVVGALSGGYTLSLVGALSPDPAVAGSVGVLGGLAIGGVAVNLLANSYRLTSGDAGYLGSAEIWSVPAGVILGGLAGGPDASCVGNACVAIMLGTHMAAMGTAWATRGAAHLSLLDDLELNLVTAAATVADIGALELPTPGADERFGRFLLAMGPIAGFTVGTLFAPKLRLTGPLAEFAAVAAGEGAMAGAFLGSAYLPTQLSGGPLGGTIPNDRRSTQTLGLALLGAGLGLGGALASTAFWQPSASDVNIAAIAALDGNLLGAGFPLFANDQGHAANAVSVGAGLGGIVAGGAALALTDHLHLSLEGGDYPLVLLGQVFGAFQGFGWASLLASGPLGDESSLGLAFTVTGASGLGLLALAQKVDLSGARGAWMYSGAVWGAWLGGWTAFLLTPEDGNGHPVLTSMLLGSDLGLAAAAFAVSPLVKLDPGTLAWMSVGGVGGLVLGTMSAVFATTDSHVIAGANLLGTTVGLVAGAALHAHFASSPGAGDDAPRASFPGESLLEGVPLPTATVAPTLDPDGHRLGGMSAQLVWTM